MEDKNKLPDWLYRCIATALLGEVYSNVRAITIEAFGSTATIRYYLDRNPTDFDYESIEVVATNLDACAPARKWEKLDVECSMHTGKLDQVRPEEVFVYSRREYGLT